MKRVFFLLLTFFCLAASGQSAGNDNFSFSFVTYAQNNIVLSVQSKVDDGCQLETRWKWSGRDTTLFFTGAELRQIMLPSTGGLVTVQAKTVTACNKQSNGPWLSISMTTLAIRDDNRQTITRAPKPVHFRVFDIRGVPQFEMDGTRPQMITRLHRLHRGVFVVFEGSNSQMIANF